MLCFWATLEQPCLENGFANSFGDLNWFLFWAPSQMLDESLSVIIERYA
jgi:hypothetical protein